jgi:hypothetical protein
MLVETPLGQAALDSFNQIFLGNPNIIISEFENWHTTTSGIINPSNPKFDEQILT